jgi:methanethiol S-methyltransferase
MEIITNFIMLLFSTNLFLLFYVLSVMPAGREKIIGERSYRQSYFLRLLSGLFEIIIIASYILYYFFPIQMPLPDKFTWSYWISFSLALIIGIPASILMILGLRDAGEESLRPKESHKMYSGIYTKLRHPQATGEVFLFLVTGLLLNSPFLTLYSMIFFPIFLVLCYAEEQDLLLRYGDAYVEYCRRTGAFWPKRNKRKRVN